MAFAQLGTLNGERPFKKGDGSVQEKINLLHNRSKHAEIAINANQIPPDGTIPVWMAEDGLRDIEVLLRWEETGDVLQDLSDIANNLEDPLTAAEKLKVAD